jgi:hypothetical protein
MEKDPSSKSQKNSEKMWSVDLEPRVDDLIKALSYLVAGNSDPKYNEKFDEYFDKATGFDKTNESAEALEFACQDREILKQDFIDNFSGAENGAKRDECRRGLNVHRKFFEINL